MLKNIECEFFDEITEYDRIRDKLLYLVSAIKDKREISLQELKFN